MSTDQWQEVENIHTEVFARVEPGSSEILAILSL